MPEEEAELLRKMDSHSWLQEDGYAYEILDEDGKSLYSSGELPETEQEQVLAFVAGLDVRKRAEQVMHQLFAALAMRFELKEKADSILRREKE